MKRSDAIEKLAEALAAAQGQIVAAEKDAKNSHFGAKYSTLAAIWEACRIPLTSNGLSVVQTPGFGEGNLILETTLLHTSGQWISSELPIQVDTRNLQHVGSALTYARRYSLAAMVGVCPDDDDGEAAVQPHREQQGKQQPPRNRERAEPRRDAPAAPKPPSAPVASGPSTKEVKRFEEELKKFCDRMNSAWVDRHTSEDGVIPAWVKDLASTFQIVGHMLKTAGVPSGGNYGERMKAAAAIWLADEASTTRGWQTYVKSIADEFKRKHAAMEPEDENQEAALVGAGGREPGSDDDR